MPIVTEGRTNCHAPCDKTAKMLAVVPDSHVHSQYIVLLHNNYTAGPPDFEILATGMSAINKEQAHDPILKPKLTVLQDEEAIGLQSVQGLSS